MLLLCVDDMIITDDNLSGIQELKDFLNQQFEMKDLRHLRYFLGLEITHSTFFLLNRTRFVTFDMLFMALNKLHKLGLPSLTLPSLAWVTLSIIMILPYFFVTLTKALFCFSYMWMV